MFFPALLLAGILMAADGATETHDLGVQCTDEEGQVTLTATMDGDYYVWYDGDTPMTAYAQKSISLDRQSGSHTYRVETYKTSVDVSHDLMSNGGFEDGNNGFTSSYRYFQDNQTGTFYLDGHENANNLYTITSNAQGFWRDFQPISAHSGSKYALFDAGQGGYAWQTNTDLNSNLTLIKDSAYAFSFWVACPNPQQYFNKPAVLQFKICWKDAEGNIQPEVNLGPSYTTTYTTGSSWVQVSASWVAPVDASWVQIGVYDSSTEAQGNDFCLDDIMFQQVTILTNQVVKTDVFTYVGENCHCHGEDMFRKWNDVVFVPNIDEANPYISYQWYLEGEPIEGATAQYYRFSAEQLNKEVYATMVCQDGTEKYTCPTRVSAVPAATSQPSAPARQILSRRVYYVGADFRIIQTLYSDGSQDTQKLF